MSETDFRQCKRCERFGHEGARFRRNTRGYYHGVCMACQSKAASERVKSDPEVRDRVLAYKRQWNATHPDQPNRRSIGSRTRRPKAPKQPKAKCLPTVVSPPVDRWVPTLRERLKARRAAE